MMISFFTLHRVMSGLFLFWWISLFWTFSSAWPRLFDDWKNTLFYFGAGICILFQLMRRSSKPFVQFSAAGIFLSLYFIVLLCSLFISSAPYESFLSFSRLLLWIGLAWALLQRKDFPFRKLFIFTTISTALIVLQTFLEITDVFHLWTYTVISKFFTPIGHTSYYGDVMMAHLPLAVFLFLTASRKWEKFFWAFLFVMIFGGLWVSLNRSSILGAFVSGLLFLFFLLRYRYLRWKPIMIATAVIAISLFLFTKYHSSFLSKNASDTFDIFWNMKFDLKKGFSSQEAFHRFTSKRLKAYEITASMIREKPMFGWGAGTFRFTYPEYAKGHLNSSTVWFMHPHNEMLHQVAELGVLGVIGLFGFFVSLFVVGGKTLSKTENGHDQLLILTALAGLVGFLISWQFSVSFLFSLSRLMMAPFVAILWRYVSPILTVPAIKLLSFRKIATAVVFASTLLLFMYHLSLYFLYESKNPENPHRLVSAKYSYVLAPTAFDPLFNYASMNFLDGHFQEAFPAIEKLSEAYPYVPSVLLLTAQARLMEGKVYEAETLLQHAIRNDPKFDAAKSFLTALQHQ
ncbi:MAG: hypothetical protein A3I05_06170 [Deltaproteobacteria bacterium RIFCSPLOWO2_02_FULL_44_10]|nr:MAG: hypothetical protein A3C46_09560 [Deltaproteobacteria bacterium RIFCSPHIGHO2_02_FULL_44_16]OGQ45134.1 MAG: hypothetical protein A3I05_06170 [Deltaproteobacteria bacterium RIFCSPLOWO2_02_FULL_44_10]